MRVEYEMRNKMNQVAVKKKKRKEMSTPLILILGAIVAAEIIIAVGMIFNIDFSSVDLIAIFLVFVVLYFGIVAGLAE